MQRIRCLNQMRGVEDQTGVFPKCRLAYRPQRMPGSSGGQAEEYADMASTYTTERRVLRAETTGSIVEVVGGIAIIVLSIIALARLGNVGALPAISTIILGAALVAEGGTIATEFSRLMAGVIGGTAGVSEFSGGMTTEIVVGAVVLVLGVLAVLGVSPGTLLPSAVIVAGGLLLIAATNVQRMNAVRSATVTTGEAGQALL
ncbi:MAG TPA: hypothetical protein VIY09_01900, partial [Rhizomicrobium sp.]